MEDEKQPSLDVTLENVIELQVMRARKDPAVFAAYVLKDEETGGTIEMQPMHFEWHDLALQHSKLLIWSHIESGKGLALDTPIPTPSGWKQMGELQPGDVIFGGDGRPANVTFATNPQFGRPCFRVKFDDGTDLVADDVHRWKAMTLDDAAQDSRVSVERAYAPARMVTGSPCECGCGERASAGKKYIRGHHTRRRAAGEWRVVNTAEMIRAGTKRVSGAKRADGTTYSQYRWRMPLSGVVDYPECELPIDPYWLGVWLGDGDSAGPTITMHADDREIGQRCESVEGPARWYGDLRNPNVMRVAFVHERTTGRMRTRLRLLGLINNKHIPSVYLMAGVKQRRELLAGLLDTDGTVSDRGGVEFANMNERIALGVAELARSLGFKTHVRTKPITAPDGRPLGDCFTVSFSASCPVFRLRRKAEKQQAKPPFGRASYRSVVSIEPIVPVPTRCITVDSPDNTYLAGDYVVTHNTQQMSIARVLWELGRNPKKRIVILSNTDLQAQKICLSISRYIEHSPELRRVFPDLKRDRSMPWNLHQLHVVRNTQAKDPSVQSIGIRGSIIGARIDLLIIDDILDVECTATKEQRDELHTRFQTTLEGRLTRFAKVICVGTAWHPDDLLHRFAARSDWFAVRYPVADDNGASTWEGRWPIERINAKRIALGPLEFARQMLCVSHSDEEARFKKVWLDGCLTRGAGLDFTYALQAVPPGFFVYTGVDLATGKNPGKGDFTCLFTIIVHPNGDREVLCIESGRWQGPEILDRIDDTHRRYQSIVIVENVSAQEYILQFARKRSAVPVLPFTTGKNKLHPEFGVESLAAEFANHKWIIPSRDGRPPAEVEAWIGELLFYDRRKHTGDRVMSSWFAREGARLAQPKRGRVGRLDVMTR